MSAKRKAFCQEMGIGKKPKVITFTDDVDVGDHDDSSDADKDELFDRVCALCDDGGELLCWLMEQNLPAFLSAMSAKRKAFCQETGIGKKPKVITFTDDEDVGDHDDSSDAEKDELFDRVCALCDDGGELLCCEGRCIRSFHPTVESGASSFCESLCYSSEEVGAIQTFLCKNCQYQRHQCFICGRLGSSDKSSGAEVFPCVSATCGHFYHPHCVSELLFPEDKEQAQELQKQIKAGNSFTCPAHKCYVCKKGEDKTMQFAICRRCPKAYHRQCLPRNISFECNDAKNIPQRAWENLLAANRILIYCLDHKISCKVLTPRRDHLLFPGVDGKTEQHPTELLPDKPKVLSERRSKAYGILTDENKVAKLSKEMTSEYTSGYSINKNKKNHAEKVSGLNLSSTMKSSKDVAISEPRKAKNPSMMKKINLFQGSGKSVSMMSVKRYKEKTAVRSVSTGSARTLRTAEMEKRIQALMKSSDSSINMEEFLDKQRRNCTQDKTITLGKVECSVQAIQAALKILQEGGAIEDAKAICAPAVLTQMVKWKKQLKVYLAPFIHGMRYTSFGRHFTNVDKLKQVVDRLCWYVRDGDTIVDFCCGSNDFSCLMKEGLDRMGKKCSFKNYDLIRPKNDFNFEKRDWMSICLEELPEGSNLIMGLNPPYGVQAFHANQFIDKALKFRPKLLILIVPKETERLDRKNTLYDLIWEDDHIFSGKSFYLPGSVDVHDQQMQQWNVDPPPLYLWSRPDWTTKHKAVALQCGHITNNGDTRYSGVSNYLMEENQDCYGDFSSVADGYGDINSILEDVPEASDDF
ncbi:Histone-lysine N-methyltransferase [Handroanthus impetiginosus]|uniref:Histone-lysine N-methyltransferase n=1 Tax=Handroanthus impetiginosus TaxID=429701 RepID=A0A2G9G835_9LAMI|nr:Histone-lysine N-methyltransferase [Handroanthus impetiginosus]